LSSYLKPVHTLFKETIFYHLLDLLKLIFIHTQFFLNVLKFLSRAAAQPLENFPPSQYPHTGKSISLYYRKNRIAPSIIISLCHAKVSKSACRQQFDACVKSVG